jgi:hypothetical protein
MIVSFFPDASLSKEHEVEVENGITNDETTENLPGHFAVWLTSPEADFLKGRFLWSHWDVEELIAKKQQIEADPNALKITLNVAGLVE